MKCLFAHFLTIASLKRESNLSMIIHKTSIVRTIITMTCRIAAHCVRNEAQSKCQSRCILALFCGVASLKRENNYV